MKNILVFGAGRIGQAIANVLTTRANEYAVTLADLDGSATEQNPDIRRIAVDATNASECVRAFSEHYAVVSALPYDLTTYVAVAAKAAGVHFLDLTEDVASTNAIRELARGAETAFIPQCGLAPGFIGILGYDMAQRFEVLESLRLRVGALPQYPANSLSYNLTWSTEGVINEYCQPCEAIVDGKRTTVPPLEEVEHFTIDGVMYEAFNTSGGLGTLCETLEGKVKRLNYRTIRYPGHRDIMKTLVHDLRLGERKELFKEVLEYAIPTTAQDVIVIFVTASGRNEGRLVQESYANRIYPKTVAGIKWTAIQITTASSVCAVIDLLGCGKIPDKGFVRQEQIRLKDFLESPFAEVFRKADSETQIMSA